MRRKKHLDLKYIVTICGSIILWLLVTYIWIKPLIPTSNNKVDTSAETVELASTSAETTAEGVYTVETSLEFETLELVEPPVIEIDAETVVDAECEDTVKYSNEESYDQVDSDITHQYNNNINVTLTDAEVYRLAALVQAEADNIYECKTAIASLVINRMVFYDMSFYDTINSPGQFVTAWGTIAYAEPQEDTIEAVYDVLNNGTTLPIYVMFYRAEYYHDWNDQLPFLNIGNTYFSYSLAHRLIYEPDFDPYAE